MSWEIITKHRQAVRAISFNILLWGSSKTNRARYKLRLAIKEPLAKKGHSVKFSEKLIKEGNVPRVLDPVADEMFHADAADIIIVLYGSRGTQTEFDRILTYEALGRKSVVVVEKKMWNVVTKQGLAGYSWKNFRGKILIIPDGEFNAHTICNKLDKAVEKFQCAKYLNKLESKLYK